MNTIDAAALTLGGGQVRTMIAVGRQRGRRGVRCHGAR